MGNLGYTRDSVERALKFHSDKHRIADWQPDTEKDNRWNVVLSNGSELELRSLREAYVFVNGLASAAQSVSLKEK